MSFEQATVLVTGGTSGIGRATAQLFGDRGAKVVVSGRDEARGQEVAAETGGRFIRADLASPEDVRRLAAEAGEVDVLVNNAGFWELGPSAETTEAGFNAMAAVNFRAPFFLTAALAPQMAARGRGAIVNVSTMVAVRGAAGMAAYGATKAALEALTRSWAAEFARPACESTPSPSGRAAPRSPRAWATCSTRSPPPAPWGARTNRMRLPA